MGEAKRRGSFEERKRMALERDAKIIKQRKIVKIDRINNISAEQKESRKRARQLLAMLSATPYNTERMLYRI